MKKTAPLLFILILSSAWLHAQTAVQVDTLEERYKACVDRGDFMLGCAYHYYDQMDSMLNVVYKKIMTGLDANKQQQLRSAQRKWLAERNKKFKKIEKEIKEMSDTEMKCIEPSQDCEMFTVDGKAAVVNERVRELIKSYSSILKEQ